MSFYPQTLHVEGKPNTRVAAEFIYSGDGTLSDPSSSCSCTTPLINGKKIQMYIQIGSWSRGQHTKYGYVKVNGVQHSLPVYVNVI